MRSIADSTYAINDADIDRVVLQQIRSAERRRFAMAARGETLQERARRNQTDRGDDGPNAGERVQAEDAKIANLPTDRQSDSHDDRHGHARWRRVAQPRRLEAPTSNRRHRSKVDLLAHAAKDAYVLHVAPTINEDLGDLESVEAATSMPERSGATSKTFFGTCVWQPTRQAEGASMWHAGGVRMVIGDSAGLCACSQHPTTTASARPMPRHRF